MKATDLNNAMQYIDDKYLDMAEAPKKEITQMSKKKTMSRIFFIAAVVAMLTVTAYAADFLNIKSLTTGNTKVYSKYDQVTKAMKQAGFQMDLKECFENGFTFEQIRVMDSNAWDENGKKVLSYKELSAQYRNADGIRLVLWAEPIIPELPTEEHPGSVEKQINGVTATYWTDHYKLVPENYEPTEEDKQWLEQPGNYLTYGSEEIMEYDVSFLQWENNEIKQAFMDMRTTVLPDVLFEMAEELIGK